MSNILEELNKEKHEVLNEKVEVDKKYFDLMHKAFQTFHERLNALEITEKAKEREVDIQDFDYSLEMIATKVVVLIPEQNKALYAELDILMNKYKLMRLEAYYLKKTRENLKENLK